MQAAVFEALGDPVRSGIVELLAGRELEAGIIASHFDVSRPAVSRHLRVLREAGVVSAREEATRRIYSLRPAVLDELTAWAERLRVRTDAQLDALGRHLDDMERSEKERKSR